MGMVPLFGLGTRSRSPTVTAQHLLNLQYEVYADADKQRLAIYGTPGMTLFTDDLGDTPVRGWIATGNLVYLVHRGTFYEMNNAMVLTSRGTLNTVDGRVNMAYDGSVILMVDGTNGYTYTISGATFAEVTDAQFPDAANTVTWLGSNFYVDDGVGDSFFWSPDGTNWDALDFATAESQPDGIVRVFADHGEILLFGENTIEPWGLIESGDAPVSPVKSAITEFGLAARWSLCKYNDGLAFLGKNLQGQVQVYYLKGYVPTPISTQELDEIINGYATVSDATGFAFMDRGHPFYQINFPTPGKSWRYDASTGKWGEVAYSLAQTRHRAELQLDFVNQTLLSDYSNGNIYRLDPDVYTDNGVQIAREIVGRHIFNQEDRSVVDELYVDFETGVGLISGQGSDPQVMLQISKDNGNTWGNELWTTLGAIGKYLTRVYWRRLGVSYDWVFKLRVTDPVKVVIAFAAVKMRKAN